ncbi:hypothetical protein [Pararhizobium sp.]|uniref:hypothetical protein n=1 Tax=Pararhizobium sp. TaxID=1977563 RepID=UPI003D14CB84
MVLNPNYKTAALPTPNFVEVQMDAVELLMASVAHEYTDFHYTAADGSDQVVPLRAPTLLQAVRLCKRYRSLLAVFDGANPVDALFDAGDEAVAAFVACAAGRERDERFEVWLADAPDGVAVDMAIMAAALMFGGSDPEVFFQKISLKLVQAGLIKTAKMPTKKTPAQAEIDRAVDALLTESGSQELSSAS